MLMGDNHDDIMHPWHELLYPRYPHPITQLGNRRHETFFCGNNYRQVPC